MKILVIEDDNHTAKNITLFLENNSYILDVVSNGQDGIEMAANYHYDIILLDIILPDMNGHEVLQFIRNKNITTPVLVLSGVNQLDERIKALQAGADDYITKPFEMLELRARIIAILRRSQTTNLSNEIKITNTFVIKTNEGAAFINDTQVPLTKKELDLLTILALRKNSVFSKEHLVDKLYHHNEEPDHKIIDVFIYKIRKKLNAISPGTGQYLQTIWGYGYKINTTNS